MNEGLVDNDIISPYYLHMLQISWDIVAQK